MEGLLILLEIVLLPLKLVYIIWPMFTWLAGKFTGEQLPEVLVFEEPPPKNHIKQEFYCEMCKHYFSVCLNKGVSEDAIFIVCPNRWCKYKNLRVVQEGVIGGRVTQSFEVSYYNEILPTSATLSKKPLVTKECQTT